MLRWSLGFFCGAAFVAPFALGGISLEGIGFSRIVCVLFLVISGSTLIHSLGTVWKPMALFGRDVFLPDSTPSSIVRATAARP